jgi:uncharacterized membrane protein YkoI
VFKGAVLVMLVFLQVSAVEAKTVIDFAGQTEMQVAQDSSQFPITPSDAANIAVDANPGAKVLNVKLLPSGVYAVTLRDGGRVSRVMVDATSGSIS